VPFDIAEMVITPVLLHLGHAQLEALVVTAPLEDHLGGLPSILRHFRVKRYFDGLVRPDAPPRELTLEGFIAAAADSRFVEEETRRLGEALFNDYRRRLLRLADAGVPMSRVVEGMDLYSERVDERGLFRVRALNPVQDPQPEPYGIYRHSVVLAVELDGTRVLIAPDLDETAERALVERHGTGGGLRAAVLVAPDPSRRQANSAELYDAVQPEVVVFQFRGRGSARRRAARTVKGVAADVERVLRTDEVGAVTISLDAGGVAVETALGVPEAEKVEGGAGARR